MLNQGTPAGPLPLYFLRTKIVVLTLQIMSSITLVLTGTFKMFLS